MNKSETQYIYIYISLLSHNLFINKIFMEKFGICNTFMTYNAHWSLAFNTPRPILTIDNLLPLPIRIPTELSYKIELGTFVSLRVKWWFTQESKNHL